MRQLARRGCQAAWSTSELFLPRVEHFHSAAAHAAAERHGQLATANHGFRIHVLTQERFGRYIATRIFAEDAGSACSLAEIHNGCCDADRSELASTRGMLITQMLVDEQLFSSMPTRWRVPRDGSREPGAGSREPGAGNALASVRARIGHCAISRNRGLQELSTMQSPIRCLREQAKSADACVCGTRMIILCASGRQLAASKRQNIHT
jgi:hypothetical protein